MNMELAGQAAPVVDGAAMPYLDHPFQLTSFVDGLGGMSAVYQPIVDLTSGQPVAYEALTRFGTGASAPSGFESARRLGLGHALELEAVAHALRGGLPPDGRRLSLNLSPSALADPTVLEGLPPDLSHLIIEVTENELVKHEDVVRAGLDGLRARGAQIAVDDAGAGYASLRQVMHLRPDIIKIDRSLVMGVDQDAAKRALIRAFVTLARDLGSRVCAEGVEHLGELWALADLDVSTAQGYLFARPGRAWPEPSDQSSEACAASLRRALRGEVGAVDPDADVTLETLGRVLAECHDGEALDRGIATAQRLLDVPEIALCRVVRDGHGPGLVACAGPRWDNEPVHRLSDFPATAHALATDEALQVLVSDPDTDPTERALLRQNGYGALLLVALRFKGQAVGIMEIFSRRDRAWSRREIILARAIAHQLALLLPHLESPEAAAVAA